MAPLRCTSAAEPFGAHMEDPRTRHSLAQAGLAMRDCIKIGRLGAGAGTTNQIRLRWRTSEVVRLRCAGKPAADMKSLAQALETATGGQVVYRSGGTIILHRGQHWQSGALAQPLCSAEPVVLQGVSDEEALCNQAMPADTADLPGPQSATSSLAGLLASNG
ncbi:hypothetical protein ACKKBG_A26440 [Auxenochlorella protothecoides x Auxenochlorella symbiontica]